MVPAPDSGPGDEAGSNPSAGRDDAKPPRRDGGTVADGSGDAPSTFSEHVSRVVDRFDDLLPFALVPLVLTVLDTERTRRALDPSPGAFSINVEFTLPTPLLDLWSFVDSPGGAGSGGVTVELPFETVGVSPGSAATWTVTVVGIAALAYAALAAVIAAGYLGGIDCRLRREPFSVGECVVAYAPRLFLYYLVVVGVILALVPFVAVAPPLLVLAFPAVIVLGYLFYAVPFLFVVDDAEFVDAFRRSYALALAGGGYLWFALAHVLVTAVASLALSVAVSIGGAGFLVALFVATPLALVLTAATVSLVQDLVGRDETAARADSAAR